MSGAARLTGSRVVSVHARRGLGNQHQHESSEDGKRNQRQKPMPAACFR
jgi:hypothetical protein